MTCCLYSRALELVYFHKYQLELVEWGNDWFLGVGDVYQLCLCGWLDGQKNTVHETGWKM